MLRTFLAATVALLLSNALCAEEPEWFREVRASFTREVKLSKDQPTLPIKPPRFPAMEYGYGEYQFPWSGVSIVWDDANQRGLFLGGHNGGMPEGDLGSWSLTEGGKWRQLQWPSPSIDRRLSPSPNPLRDQALAARRSAKDAEGLARAAFYAAHDPAEEALAAQTRPAGKLAEAIEIAADLGHATSKKDEQVQANAIIKVALKKLLSAHAALSAGKLSAENLRQCFDAQWKLDEAADFLAASPPPREFAAAAYDPATKQVVYFGGSHHDYMLNDTWLFDCTNNSWKHLSPKTAPSARMKAKFTTKDGKFVLSGGETVLNKMVYQKGEMPAPEGEWTFDFATKEWSGPETSPPDTRIYRTIVPAYDPRWYDAAPRGNKQETADWLAKLEPNVWTAVPEQPAPAPERDWGTAVFDPDRDQIYRWTGGHCADPSSNVSTYHPAINRWSIPFVPDIIADRKGMSFSGRPDCANHTYLHYAYDPVSKRLICPSYSGTGVFNPDIGDFEFSADQPFHRHIYETCATSTPRGVLLWSRDRKMYLFDYAGRVWKEFPFVDKLPRPVCDGSTMCYDSKRDAVWLASFKEYQKPSGQIWRCDLETGKVTEFTPANAETIGKAKGFNGEIRESVYVPTLDLVLFNNFVDGGEVAYDPKTNRWIALPIKKTDKRHGGVSDTLTWDPKRQLVWNLNSYKAIFVLKLEEGGQGMGDREQR